MMMKTDQQKTDMELMEKCYRRFLCGMTCHACKFVPEHIAADIVQDVFLKLWQTNREFYRIDDISAQQLYLYKCISNACHDWIKHSNVVNNHSCPIATSIRDEEIYWYENLMEREDFNCRFTRITEAAESLPERCREIFIMHYIRQKKAQEIALELGISVRTVESQLYKALSTLRSILKEKK